ncbi:MAG: hypothetical protein GXP45_04040 [bacterium]|nr:hypothetical protein [bacterium]
MVNYYIFADITNNKHKYKIMAKKTKFQEMELIVPLNSKVRIKMFFDGPTKFFRDDPLKLLNEKRLGQIQSFISEYLENENTGLTIDTLMIKKHKLFGYLDRKLHDAIPGDFSFEEFVFYFKD